MTKTIRVAVKASDYIDFHTIKPLQGNYKIATDEQVEKLIRLIKKRGIRFTSFVSKIGKDIWAIDTHRRLVAYEKLEQEGYIIPPIPVDWVEAKDKKEAKQLLLECDSSFGKRNQQGFEDFISDLDTDFLSDIEIPDIDIDFGEEPYGGGQDEAPEIQEEAVSVMGEMYELGNSILMCGDSTDPETIRRLMGADKADMLLTDPPYSMHMGGKGCFKETRKNMQDRVKDIIDFDVKSLEFVLSMGINNIFIFTSKALIKDYLNMFDGYKYDIHVWCKSNQTPFTNNTFIPDIEYLLYFHKTGRVWNNALKPADIYKRYYVSSQEAGKKDTGDLHPTMKPVDLLSNKIKICSNKGGIVLDLFGGSGSTLIAVEKNNRRARICEISPNYCDVIRRRWTKWAMENNRETGSGGLD